MRTETGHLVQCVLEQMTVQLQQQLGAQADLVAWRQAIVAGFPQPRLRGQGARLAQAWLQGHGLALAGD